MCLFQNINDFIYITGKTLKFCKSIQIFRLIQEALFPQTILILLLEFVSVSYVNIFKLISTTTGDCYVCHHGLCLRLGAYIISCDITSNQ